MIMGFVYFPQRTGQLCRGFSQIMREFNTCFSQRIDIKHILQPPPFDPSCSHEVCGQEKVQLWPTTNL